jgi:hypothetical protein
VRESAQLIDMFGKFRKIAVNVTHAGRQIGFGFAAMKDRHLMALFIEPARDVRTDEFGATENQDLHSSAPYESVSN